MSNLAKQIEPLETDGTPLIVNMGPSHPAFHGALRTQVYLDGETIVKAKSEIGYLHRCFEKHAENSTYQQVIPYTDRLNYVSSLMNNVGYCKAVEDLMGVVVPDRAIIIRVLICELSRVIDHLVCVGTNLVDLGALTNFWYTFNVREKAYDFIEKISGARLTYSYTRIGGLSRDLYSGYEKDLKVLIRDMRQAINDVKGLVLKNRIFIDRTRDVCVVSKKQALDWGFTGPCLRASGVPFDLRKAEPYYYYETFDFDIPVGTGEKGTLGDCWDRYNVRMREMTESIKIIKQVLEGIEDGPVIGKVPKIIKVPEGEIYSRTECPRGELGYHLISDGGKTPYRLKVKSSCFTHVSVLPEVAPGLMIADFVATIGSIDIVLGEVDR